jgi:hypothetical protein
VIPDFLFSRSTTRGFCFTLALLQLLGMAPKTLVLGCLPTKALLVASLGCAGGVLFRVSLEMS